MNCQDVCDNQHIYLDGELAERDAVELEVHLGVCEPCRRQIDLSHRVRQRVRASLRQPITAPAGLRQRVSAGLVEKRSGVDYLGAWALPGALAAGLAAVFLWPSTEPSLRQEAKAASASRPHWTPKQVAGIRGVSKTSTELVTARKRDRAVTSRVAAASRRMRETRPRARVGTSARTGAAALRLVANPSHSEVLGGGVDDDFLGEADRVNAVRTAENLRALVASHQLALPPEVEGGGAKLRSWLHKIAPGHASLPVIEGAGVRLEGARLGHVGPHRVVSFRYHAFGKPVTVVRYLGSAGAGRGGFGAIRDHMAGYSIVHAAHQGDVLGIVGELDPQALTALIEPPKFL